jgi:hypothetical protein
MIKNEREYQSAKQALEHVEKALTSLHKELYQKSPERYHIIAESYLNYIKKLRHDIDLYIGLVVAEEKSAPLWIRLKGPYIGEGNISIVLLSNFLDNFKMGVQRVADYINEHILIKRGRPKEEIRSLCDFNVKILPGSVRIGLSFPSPYAQKTLYGEYIENPAEEAVKRIIKVASWSVGLEKKNIESIIPQEEERHLILTQIDKIIPSIDEKVSSIEFRGKYTHKDAIILTKKSSEKIKMAIERAIPPEKTIEIGIIREIDLDKKHFDLRERPKGKKELHCRYDEILYEEAIEGLDKKVRVVGELYSDKFKKPLFLNVEKIDILGEKD